MESEIKDMNETKKGNLGGKCPRCGYEWFRKEPESYDEFTKLAGYSFNKYDLDWLKLLCPHCIANIKKDFGVREK